MLNIFVIGNIKTRTDVYKIQYRITEALTRQEQGLEKICTITTIPGSRYVKMDSLLAPRTLLVVCGTEKKQTNYVGHTLSRMLRDCDVQIGGFDEFLQAVG